MMEKAKSRTRTPRKLLWLAALSVALSAGIAQSENIDPDADDSQFAWAENAGWVNAQPLGSGGPGVHVFAEELTGWAWSENLGWISLSCANTVPGCAAVDYGVTNNGFGELAGWGWAENAGWVSFSCANTASCGSVDFGVTIDPASGEFSGEAWAENAGWLRFRGTGVIEYGVVTSWLLQVPVPTASVWTLLVITAALLLVALGSGRLSFARAS